MADSSQLGSPGITYQSIYEESSTAKHKLGERLQLGERVFYYCGNSSAAALTPGNLVQGAVPITLNRHSNLALGAAAAVGATRLKITPVTTAITANQYAEGWLWVNDATGEGGCYKVRGHAAISAAAEGEIEIYDGLAYALTTSSEVSLHKNAYKDVIVAPVSTLTAQVLGVPLIDVTASYYFWLQTWGPCAIHAIGTLITGSNAASSAGTTAGSVLPYAAATIVDTVVGTVMQISVTTEKALIFLRLAA